MTKIMDTLSKFGIKCEFEKPIYVSYGGGFAFCDNASVDHCGDYGHSEFVEKVLKSEGRLIRYLFSADSFVLTGNDNVESDVSINVKYPHEEYYKGN